MDWLAHAALCILLAGSLFSDSRWLRAGIIVASIVGIAATILALEKPGLAFWLALIVVANLMVLAKQYVLEGRVRFTDAEKLFRERQLGGLSRRAAREFIDLGHWVNGMRGQILARGDLAAPNLYYVAEGSAEVFHANQSVGHRAGGDVVGPGTLPTVPTATDAVQLITNANLWFVPAATLQRYFADHDDVAAALAHSFGQLLNPGGAPVPRLDTAQA